MDRETFNHFVAILTFLETAGIPHAVGGAVAMAAYGYNRATSDIDIFIDPNQLDPVLGAMRALGYNVRLVFDETHYEVSSPELDRRRGDREAHADLLFASADPDWSALMAPDLARIYDREISVFPAVLLAAAKFYAGRVKDELDLVEMLSRGIYNPVEVQAMLRAMQDEEAALAFEAMVARWRAPRPRRNRPPKGTLRR